MLIVTGFSPAGYVQYGQNFVETFKEFWPLNIEMRAYVEEPTILSRGIDIPVWSCVGCAEFIARYRDDSRANGRESRGYNFKFDAVKFCRQMFIPEHAASSMIDGDVMTWLDGDVITFADVPPNFVEGLLGDADIVYLGRENNHSEIGFWAMRVNSRTRQFVYELADCYRSGLIFTLKEWHSAFVFDYYRQRAGLKERNLTPGGKNHVWFQSPLCRYMDHLKGERKKIGRSKERAV